MAQLPFSEYGSGENILVLLHGYGADRNLFRPLIPRLEKQFRIITLDLRGHGEAVNIRKPFHFDQFAADVIETLDNLNIQQFNLMGYSMGGFISQIIVRNYPQRVLKLVLGCTSAYKNDSFYERTIEKRGLPILLSLIGIKNFAKLVFPGAAGGKPLDPESLKQFKSTLAKNDPENIIEIGAEIFKFDNRPCLKQIQIPTLVLGAKKDFIVPFRHSQLLADNISNARLHVFQDAGHGAIFTHRTEMAEAIQAFFK